MDLIHTAGLIIRFKKIRMVNELKNNKWIDSKYYDVHFRNMESILQSGFGFGFVKNDYIPLTLSLKIGVGGLLSFLANILTLRMIRENIIMIYSEYCHQ